jgi:hypothetical protein
MPSLFDSLQKYDMPKQVKPDPLEYAVCIKNTKPRPGVPEGYRLMICTIDPPPQSVIDEAERLSLPLFTPAEINRLAQDPHPERIRTVVMSKSVFTGGFLLDAVEK